MRVAIPHNLDRQTVRDRLRKNSHRLAEQLPGTATVETSWRGEDTMAMTVRALGQELRGEIEIEEGQVVFNLALPPALAFLEPIVEGAVKQSGQKLIAGPGD